MKQYILLFLAALLTAASATTAQGAETNKKEDFGAYIPDDQYQDDQSGSLETPLTTFDASGVTWTASRGLGVRQYVYIQQSRGQNDFYGCNPYKAFLYIPSNSTINIDSNELQNVVGFSMRIISHGTYTSGNVQLLTGRGENWNDTPVATLEAAVTPFDPQNDLSNYTCGNTENKPYDPANFTEFSHTFADLPYNGRLRLRIVSPFDGSGYTQAYYAIPEITVKFQGTDAESGCANCFLVTF